MGQNETLQASQHMSPPLAIVALCAGLIVWASLPLLPALIELYRRQDVVPLNVPPAHHRDLRHFAWVFRDYVRGQLGQMDSAPVGGRHDRRRRFPDGTTVHIVNATTPYVPDLSDRRRAAKRQRVMVSTEPLVVPDGVKELGEVYATGDLVGGSNCVYRAVFCEGNVELGDRSVVLRWIHAAGALHAGSGSQLLGRTTAEMMLHVDEGCYFERMLAPRILFGVAVEPGDSMPDRSTFEERQKPGAADVALQRVDGDYSIPAHTRVADDLIVHGNVTVGDHCLLLGSLKAGKLAQIGRGTRVIGSITAIGNLYLAPECVVQGALVGESDIFIDEGARIGSAAKLTTVTAERIYVAPSVVTHGLVWARRVGVVARF
jgi:predicted acyltransferase (DUF342 family)